MRWCASPRLRLWPAPVCAPKVTQLAVLRHLSQSVHVFLGERGSVGKTPLAALFAEWLALREAPPVVFDGSCAHGVDDLCRGGISSYSALSPRRVFRFDDPEWSRFNHRLEVCFEEILDPLLHENGPFVIDINSTATMAWKNFVHQISLADLLLSVGRTIYFHLVGSGDGILSACNEVHEISRRFPRVKIVLWVNEFDSSASPYPGLRFAESQDYADVIGHLTTVLDVPRPTTLQRDALVALQNLRLLVSQISSLRSVNTPARPGANPSLQRVLSYKKWGQGLFDQLDDRLSRGHFLETPSA